MIDDLVTALFSTLAVAAGWFYLARSRGVERLSGVESPRRNLARRRTRRMGAWAMVLLGLSFFWMQWELQNREERSPPRVLATLLLVTVSLVTMVACAMIDMYLTYRMRQSNRPPKP